MSTMSTVLITGCSSGFGLETARLFLDRGWRVVATMRTPNDCLLPQSERLRILPLDVTDAESIRQCIQAAGPIDALVNNAGVGLLAPLEDIPLAKAREVFETNTLGTIAMTQAVLPQFRQRGAGVVVNVTSSVTLKSLPLLSVYTGSKAAVNAFTESLALELAPFDVRVRLVLPGRSPETSFGDNARRLMGEGVHEAYADFRQRVFAAVRNSDAPVTHAHDVAEAVWRAVTDPAAPLRVLAGADALALAAGPEINNNDLKAIVARFNREVIQDGNRESFEALMAPDFVNWSAPSEALRGAETMWKTFSTVLRPAIGDLQVHIHEQLCDGDKVITRKTISGKHVGPLLGVEATGKDIAIDVTDIVRVRDGRYVEHWGINTLAAVVAQLRQG
ncbi:hypothetical protein GCM10027318_26100 [Massilia agilis]